MDLLARFRDCHRDTYFPMYFLNNIVWGRISKSFPINFIVLGAFTLCESYLVTYTTMMYTPESVLLSGVATLSATLGLTYYAMTTK